MKVSRKIILIVGAILIMTMLFSCGQPKETATTPDVSSTPSGDTLEVFAGNIGVVWNDRLRSMFRHAEHKNGVLYVPLKWIAGVWLNKFVSQLDGVLYVSNRYGLLTRNLAAIITELLG